MSLADKLQNILETKNEIKDAINSKGGNITASTPFSEYATQISNIKTTPEEKSRTIIPSTTNQTVTENNFTVTVNGDADLVPENIAKGKNIFGIDGTYEGEIKEVKLQDVSTDGRTSFITPGDGFDGLSRVYIDNTDLILAEKNLNALISESGAGDEVKFYDVNSNSVRTNLFYGKSHCSKVTFRNATTIGSNSFSDMLDITEFEAPECTLMLSSAFSGSYRLLNADLPKLSTIYASAFYNSFYHPNNYKSKLNIGHIKYIDASCFVGCGHLSEINIGSANRNFHMKDYTGHLAYYPIQPGEENFIKLPSNLFRDCADLEALILPEVHGIYQLKGSLFETTPTNFKVYVDDTMIDSYKNDTTWAQYADRIVSINEHPSYAFNFTFDADRLAYKITRYNNYENATEANALQLLIPRSFRGYPVILTRDIFNGCYFDKLIISSGVVGMDDYCLSGATIKTLEFEDFSKILSIGEEAYLCNRIENLILNCTVKEYFTHFLDTFGYIYSNDVQLNLTKLASPWVAEHIYSYPEFEVTDMFIPTEPFKNNHMLGWGSMKDSHFNNVYINRNINIIWNYAFWNAKNTNIYIPKEVTTVKEASFFGLWNSNIYCEVEERPSNWDSAWDRYFEENNVTVHWGSQM